jgi:glycine oxidase
MKKRVVIVGAGVVGLHCAVRLAKAGAEVTLLEAEAEHPQVYGPMASAAAAGMLAPLEDKPSPHERLALASLDLWRLWREGAEWADGVRFDGAVVVAETSQVCAGFQASAARLGRHAQSLNATQIKKSTGVVARCVHAVFVEDEGLADPLRVLTGLAMQARALGVSVNFNADVRLVAPNVVTTHDDRVFEADAIVLAPGAWATEALHAAASALKHVRPGKGQMAAVALPHSVGPNLRAPGFYVAQQLEQAVLGSTLEFDRFDRRVNKGQIAALCTAADAIFPDQVRYLDRAWAGIRPMSPDGWPMIGPGAHGIFVAAGHSRNGWLLAPITAEIMTAYIFDGAIAPEWAGLSPERFGNA